jgi:hypothetical protein
MSLANEMNYRYKAFVNLAPEQGIFKNTIIGHMIIEELIRDLVEIKLEKASVLENSSFTFFQLTVLTEGLYGKTFPSWLWPATRKLNKIRNKYAHNLCPEDTDELLSDFNEFVFKESGLKKKEQEAKRLIEKENSERIELRKSQKKGQFRRMPKKSVLDQGIGPMFHRAIIELAETYYSFVPKAP